MILQSGFVDRVRRRVSSVFNAHETPCVAPGKSRTLPSINEVAVTTVDPVNLPGTMVMCGARRCPHEEPPVVLRLFAQWKPRPRQPTLSKRVE
jgi:hypothetical protein